MDSARGVNVVTGSSSAFYPEYDSDDPIAAMERGYYFDGLNSIMRADSMESFSPIFSMSVWAKHENSGVVFSKNDKTFDY